MILESKYQQFIKEETQNFVLRIRMGLVYFAENVVVKKSKGLEIEVAIKRTDNKNRQRADASERHGSGVLSGS